MPIDLTVAAYLLAAVIVAVVIRLMDDPATVLIVGDVIQWKAIVPTVAGIAIAVPLVAWIMGLNVLDPKGFIEIVGVGSLGLAAVKAAINKLTPAPA